MCPCSFFLYFLVMALVNQVAITLFRAIGAIGRAAVLCNVAAFIYIAFTLMLCGFIIIQGLCRPPCLAESALMCAASTYGC